MRIFYWMVLLFLVTYEPVYGYFDYQNFKRRVAQYPLDRVKYYKKVMLGLWIPTVLILTVTAFGSLNFQDIGFNGITINTSTLGTGVTYFSFGLAGLYLVSLIYYLIGSKVSIKMRADIAELKKREHEKIAFKDILPQSKEDRRVWTFVSWTAGITEEIIYRGFLIFALFQLFPGLSIWPVLILSSLIFGLAHTYQGILNVIKTSLIGLFFAILYIGLESIVPLIILHFLIDYVGKIGEMGKK